MIDLLLFANCFRDFGIGWGQFIWKLDARGIGGEIIQSCIPVGVEQSIHLRVPQSTVRKPLRACVAQPARSITRCLNDREDRTRQLALPLPPCAGRAEDHLCSQIAKGLAME